MDVIDRRRKISSFILLRPKVIPYKSFACREEKITTTNRRFIIQIVNKVGKHENITHSKFINCF